MRDAELLVKISDLSSVVRPSDEAGLEFLFLDKFVTLSLLIFQEDVEEEAEVENESEAKPSTPSTRGGRGRGAGTARRSRGRRGGAP